MIGDERAELEGVPEEQQRESAGGAEQARQAEFKTRRDAISRLLGMGLSAEQVAEALSLSVGEVTENAGR